MNALIFFGAVAWATEMERDLRTLGRYLNPEEVELMVEQASADWSSCLDPTEPELDVQASFSILPSGGVDDVALQGQHTSRFATCWIEQVRALPWQVHDGDKAVIRFRLLSVNHEVVTPQVEVVQRTVTPLFFWVPPDLSEADLRRLRAVLNQSQKPEQTAE